MFAKRFFYMSGAILCLVGAHQIGARAAGAQGSGVQQEVVVKTGVLKHGETIPLPTYADGVEAPESDCDWSVAWQSFDCGVLCASPCSAGSPYLTELHCDAPGRVINAYARYGCGTGGTFAGLVSYTIIAVRSNGGPTPAARESWGTVKARYR